jgi:gamma-glutamyl:cysteine ligase YbdK (ATP-grasp superfamily)
MDAYGRHAARVASVAGAIVPEAVFTRHEYEERLLGGIYRDLAPLDPDGVLRHEWVNARGAIARFDRGAIEIRLLDVQESPAADLAVVSAVVGVVRALVDERLCTLERQKSWAAERLRPILVESIRSAEGAIVTDTDYLGDMGLAGAGSVTGGELWRRLVDTAGADVGESARPALETILTEGSLASRILRAVVSDGSSIEDVYRSLCACLAGNRIFHPGMAWPG